MDVSIVNLFTRCQDEYTNGDFGRFTRLDNCAFFLADFPQQYLDNEDGLIETKCEKTFPSNNVGS